MNYSELLQLTKGWGKFNFYRVIIWRLLYIYVPTCIPLAAKGGRYLYTFKDAKKAAAEEASYLANAQKNRSFSPDGYAKKKAAFLSDRP
ncbi:hypothetical protein [Hungatella hathewayi]|uniref:hypothetical protein n=1 Tax=Hungatella hathewayi TaxID=154046 RepID=UPI003567DAD9